jgi:hypothetical protein
MGAMDMSKLSSASTFAGTEIDTSKMLDRALEGASPERLKIFETLKQRPWFRNTSNDVQLELALLPETPKNNWNGYLTHLGERPDRISNVNVVGLRPLKLGNFGVISVFDVESDEGGKYTYEFFSWRYGSASGAKGLVLFETDGTPTHFLVLSGEKFATGKLETDSPGGFIDLNIDGVLKAVDRIKNEIKGELNLDDLILAREPVDLGKLIVDAGLTNNAPEIFLASIDISHAKKIHSNPVNTDPYELASKVVIYPISQLKEVVLKNNDSFFLACVARGWAAGLVPFI